MHCSETVFWSQTSEGICLIILVSLQVACSCKARSLGTRKKVQHWDYRVRGCASSAYTRSRDSAEISNTESDVKGYPCVLVPREVACGHPRSEVKVILNLK